MQDEVDDVFSVVFADHKRLVAERFRRIWQLVEDIASDPGKSRKEFANQFALSERQVQADLNVIRREMDLPLVRRQGYRFLIESPERSAVLAGRSPVAADAAAARGARPEPADGPPAVDDGQAAVRLPAALAAAGGQDARGGVASDRGGRQQEIFAALAEACFERVT